MGEILTRLSKIGSDRMIVAPASIKRIQRLILNAGGETSPLLMFLPVLAALAADEMPPSLTFFYLAKRQRWMCRRNSFYLLEHSLTLRHTLAAQAKHIKSKKIRSKRQLSG